MEFNGKTLTVFGEIDNPAALQEHINNKENPHGVTAAQVGAAPAGYGLGQKTPATTSWNSAASNAFVYGNSGSPDNFDWWGINSKYKEKLGAQIAFRYIDSTLIEARRYFNPDNQGAWEYVNPPMLEGVEYRTIERWLGKPVYTKIIRFSITDTAYFGMAIGEDVISVIRFSGVHESEDGSIVAPLPHIENRIVVDNTTQSIFVTEPDDWGSTHSVIAQLWYIKP